MSLAGVLVNSEPPGSTQECRQISLMLDGEFAIEIGSETKRLAKADAFYASAGVRH